MQNYYSSNLEQFKKLIDDQLELLGQVTVKEKTTDDVKMMLLFACCKTIYYYHMYNLSKDIKIKEKSEKKEYLNTFFEQNFVRMSLDYKASEITVQNVDIYDFESQPTRLMLDYFYKDKYPIIHEGYEEYNGNFTNPLNDDKSYYIYLTYAMAFFDDDMLTNTKQSLTIASKVYELTNKIISDEFISDSINGNINFSKYLPVVSSGCSFMMFFGAVTMLGVLFGYNVLV